jgi:hypothetical protein
MAAIDWEAAITALDSGGLPCSGGERRILKLSASLAVGTPIDLRDTVTGTDKPQYQPAAHRHLARDRETTRH